MADGSAIEDAGLTAAKAAAFDYLWQQDTTGLEDEPLAAFLDAAYAYAYDATGVNLVGRLGLPACARAEASDLPATSAGGR